MGLGELEVRAEGWEKSLLSWWIIFCAALPILIGLLLGISFAIDLEETSIKIDPPKRRSKKRKDVVGK